MTRLIPFLLCPYSCGYGEYFPFEVVDISSHTNMFLVNSTGQRSHENDLGTISLGPHTVSLSGLKLWVYFLELRMNKEPIQNKIIFTREGALYIHEKDENQPGTYLWGLARRKWSGNESTRSPYGFIALHEKPQRELRVLPLSFSRGETADITPYEPNEKGVFSLSPHLTDNPFRIALFNRVVPNGYYSWIPEVNAVIYTGERVYPPGYYRVFYLDPPVKGFPCPPDSLILMSKIASDPEKLYPWPIEDHPAPQAIRVHRTNGIDFYAVVLIPPDPDPSELSARVRIHLWATKMTIHKRCPAISITRGFDLRLKRDRAVAGG